VELIERIEGWYEGGRFDVFHPTYGPFPDFAGLYEDDEHQFLCGVWVDAHSWVCLVEGPKLEGPSVWTTGLYSTYRWWWVKATELVCGISGRDWSLCIPKDMDSFAICEWVAPASIDLYMTVQR
jgi:hypothetical protein